MNKTHISVKIRKIFWNCLNKPLVSDFWDKKYRTCHRDFYSLLQLCDSNLFIFFESVSTVTVTVQFHYMYCNSEVQSHTLVKLLEKISFVRENHVFFSKNLTEKKYKIFKKNYHWNLKKKYLFRPKTISNMILTGFRNLAVLIFPFLAQNGLKFVLFQWFPQNIVSFGDFWPKHRPEQLYSNCFEHRLQLWGHFRLKKIFFSRIFVVKFFRFFFEFFH